MLNNPNLRTRNPTLIQVSDVEKIVRWVLGLPQRPAVLLLHLYDFCGSRGGGKTNEELRKACYKPHMQVGPACVHKVAWSACSVLGVTHSSPLPAQEAKVVR